MMRPRWFREVARDRGWTDTPACHAGTVVRAVLVVMLLAAVARAGGPAAADARPAPAGAGDALAELLAHTDLLAREVAHVRGLRLKRPIPNEVVDRAELHARLVAEAGKDTTAAETAARGLALRRWGLVPLDYDYGASLIELLADQIAGFYDHDTKKLTILDTAGADPAWAEMVLAHELDHGLQDQAFDLATFEKLPDDDGDAELARHALVEGDGVALMIEVVLARHGVLSPWSVPEAAGAVLAAMAEPGPTKDSLDRAPLAIREEMVFPYRDGFAFVAALRRTHPWSAIDHAYRRPPRSTEQILHPDKYLADDKPIAVTAGASPLADYAVLDSEVWGELGVRSFLRTHGITEEVAAQAAAGWGGDRAVVLGHRDETQPRRAIAIARLEWDTEIDAREAQSAFERAVDDLMVGATLDQTTARTRWLGLDGTEAWVERRDASLVVVVGVPMQLATELDPWTVLRPAASARVRRGG